MSRLLALAVALLAAGPAAAQEKMNVLFVVSDESTTLTDTLFSAWHRLGVWYFVQ